MMSVATLAKRKMEENLGEFKKRELLCVGLTDESSNMGDAFECTVKKKKKMYKVEQKGLEN